MKGKAKLLYEEDYLARFFSSPLHRDMKLLGKTRLLENSLTSGCLVALKFPDPTVPFHTLPLDALESVEVSILSTACWKPLCWPGTDRPFSVLCCVGAQKAVQQVVVLKENLEFYQAAYTVLLKHSQFARQQTDEWPPNNLLHRVTQWVLKVSPFKNKTGRCGGLCL